MTKKSSKILYGILIIGVVSSIISLFNGEGGSGLYNFLTVISLTSIIVFFGALIILVSSYKKSKSKMSVWVLLVISAPITLTVLSSLSKNIYYNSIQTTTPKEHLNNERVAASKYENDKIEMKQLTKSLIKKKNNI